MAQINKSTDYFNTVLNTGDDTSPKSITGVGFQPDLVWTKSRTSGTTNHTLFDSVRGAGSNKELSSNSSTAEGGNQSSNYGYLSSFDSDGFTATIGSIGANYFNQSGETYVNWNWLASNSTASNTDGSITSTVSANTTSGFSIVSYTGTGSNATVGHGLGATPKFVTIKNRTTSGWSWKTHHVAITPSQRLHLNTTDGATTDTTAFNSTAPTSSVFSVGTSVGTNGSSDNMIAYCFSEKKGFSKFGSYTGNGSNDGPFIYTGFKPAWVMTKRTDSTSAWQMFDNTRSPSNPTDKRLKADENSAEDTNLERDFLSNGFKIRTNNATINGSGVSMIYMAFAENPLVGTNNIPATAR